MLDVVESTPLSMGQAELQPEPSALLRLGEVMTLNGLQSQEQTASPLAEAGASTSLDQLAMPESHAGYDVNPATLTRDGLLAQCTGLARMVRDNPDLGERVVSSTLQTMRETATMRQLGLGNEQIRSNIFAANRARLQERLAAERAEKPKAEIGHEEKQSAAATDDMITHAAQVDAEQIRTVSQTNSSTEAARIAYIDRAAASVAQMAEHVATIQEAAVITEASRISQEMDAPVSLRSERADFAAANTPVIQHEAIADAKPLLAGHEHLTTPTEPESVPVPFDHTPAEVAEVPLTVADDETAASEMPLSRLSVEHASTEIAQASEPLHTYENFARALLTVIGTSGESGSASHDSETAGLSAAEAPEVQPLPAISIVVAERLSELEDNLKEDVAPVIADVVEAARHVTDLTSEQARPEAVEKAQVELEALVTTLFESLGIEYEATDIEQFIALVLKPEFMSALSEQSESIAPDLETEGTHEAKLHFAHLTSALADVEDEVRYALGSLVTFLATGATISS